MSAKQWKMNFDHLTIYFLNGYKPK